MPVLNLPPGCAGVDPGGNSRPIMADRPGGHVTISDEQADVIGRQDGGVLSGRPGTVLATRKGRRCPSCGWRGQVWTRTCRRCERHGLLVPTVPE
jgi:hypothetical protein